MLSRTAILAALLAATAAAQTAPEESANAPAAAAESQPAKPSVTRLDESRFQIERITFDSKSREIRVPSKVNMNEGLLEFILVNEKGKLHESLFSTEASPTSLNLAFTLLRYKPSRELYPIPKPSGGGYLDAYPEVAEDIRKSARIQIDVEWDDHGNTRRIPVNEWVQHSLKATSMPAGPWVYGASEFVDGKYSPELEGDMVAIFTTLSSIINYPGADRNDDTVWTPFPKRVPAPGTVVTLILSPFSK